MARISDELQTLLLKDSGEFLYILFPYNQIQVHRERGKSNELVAYPPIRTNFFGSFLRSPKQRLSLSCIFMSSSAPACCNLYGISRPSIPRRVHRPARASSRTPPLLSTERPSFLPSLHRTNTPWDAKRTPDHTKSCFPLRRRNSPQPSGRTFSRKLRRFSASCQVFPKRFSEKVPPGRDIISMPFWTPAFAGVTEKWVF